MRRRIYKKCKPVRDERARAEWAENHTFCQACGRKEEAGHVFVALQVHHIAKFRRSDEPCNWFRVCLWCHGAIETSGMIDQSGEKMPRLTLGMVLRLKRFFDPSEHNPVRLAELKGEGLPEEEPVPDYYLKLLVDRVVRYVDLRVLRE